MFADTKPDDFKTKMHTTNMNPSSLLALTGNARTPKFLQLVDSVIANIERGVFRPGDRLPSINEISIEHYVARATVEKAYNLLQEQGHVVSRQRRGYFIVEKRVTKRLLLLVGKLNDTSEQFYQELSRALGRDYKVDLFAYEYRKSFFCDILNHQLGNYHYFIVHPQHIEPCEHVRKVLAQIPAERLIYIDGQPDRPSTSNALPLLLHHHAGLFDRYRAVRLVASDAEYIPVEWLRAFEHFCARQQLDYQLLDDLDEEPIQPQTAYILFNDGDLVELIKTVKERGWTLGQTVGVLSYQDQTYKEVLAGGISSFGPDARQLARQVSDRLTRPSAQPVAVSLQLVQRASL